MAIRPLTHRQQKAIFIFGVTVVYLAIVTWLDFLQGPFWWDEKHFWESALVFNDNLWPSLEELKTYDNLNTPLPFILFGALDYLFGGAYFSGRVFNLILSLGIAFVIGWPSKEKSGRALLCLIGLFMCPYFLWLSGRLYTEMVACSFVLWGMIAYFKGRHLLSALAFILAIASRQYMLAFPMAIATYEFVSIGKSYSQRHPIDLRQHWRWIAPGIACLSIFFWFYIFQGMAPESAIADHAPEVQKSTLALAPGGMINFLSFLGVYLVIPELILFWPEAPLESFKQNRKSWTIMAVILAVFCLIFPPLDFGQGIVMKIGLSMPQYWLQFLFFYSLALLTCLRFSTLNLYFWLVLFNSLIMMKAYPWDRYALPLVVIFWYLKSIDYPNPGQTKIEPLAETEL